MKVGSRLRSTVCSTEVIVVRAPAEELAVECGGAPMELVAAGGQPGLAAAADGAPGTLAGKRYGSEELGIELLCTKAGSGSLSVAGEALAMRGAKHLPSSD